MEGCIFGAFWILFIGGLHTKQTAMRAPAPTGAEAEMYCTAVEIPLKVRNRGEKETRPAGHSRESVQYCAVYWWHPAAMCRNKAEQKQRAKERNNALPYARAVSISSFLTMSCPEARIGDDSAGSPGAPLVPVVTLTVGGHRQDNKTDRHSQIQDSGRYKRYSTYSRRYNNPLQLSPPPLSPSPSNCARPTACPSSTVAARVLVAASKTPNTSRLLQSPSSTP